MDQEMNATPDVVATPIRISAYEVNGRAVEAADFTAAACDPRHSVVVEACAGSGKTWLLVARMLRLLLAAPSRPSCWRSPLPARRRKRCANA